MTSFGPSRPRSPSFPVRALQGATLLGTSSRPPAGARAPPQVLEAQGTNWPLPAGWPVRRSYYRLTRTRTKDRGQVMRC